MIIITAVIANIRAVYSINLAITMVTGAAFFQGGSMPWTYSSNGSGHVTLSTDICIARRTWEIILRVEQAPQYMEYCLVVDNILTIILEFTYFNALSSMNETI